MRNPRRALRAAGIFLLFAAGTIPAVAAPAAAVSGGWFRSLPGKLPAAGYFDLRNAGPAVLRLIGASSPACGTIMLHRSQDTGGMSGMADMTDVDVPANGRVAFAPGGLHLMCMDPTSAMRIGAHVPVRLHFAGAPDVEADFVVRGAKG